MKIARNILAYVCGLTVLASAIYSSFIIKRMRVILVELGDVTIPLSSRIFFAMPPYLYLVLGLAIGSLLVWTIRKTQPAWASLPITLLTGIVIFAYLGIFSVSMLKPIGGLISGLNITETNKVEQAESTVPSKAAPSAPSDVR